MGKKKSFPTREELNEAFHLLQDQITRITVEEDQEMIQHQLQEKQDED